jgi:hypothetical protein
MGGGANGVNVDSVPNSEISSAAAAIQTLAKTPLSIYVCPSDTLPALDNDGYAKANYCGNIGTVNDLSASSRRVVAGRVHRQTTRAALPLSRAPQASSPGKQRSAGKTPCTAAERIAQWATAAATCNRGANARRHAIA